MKQKILSIIIVCILVVGCFTGCSHSHLEETTEEETKIISSYFVEIASQTLDYNIHYSEHILVDRETRVMYLFISGSERGGLSVMLNADGTPRLWDGEL